MMTTEMGTGQRSSFAVTCNLLSQYIKENNRALGDLRGVRLPMTMSLLPGVETEKEGELGRTAAARSMDLFPQQAGFGSPPAVDVSNGGPEKSQLTIFYGGKVMVFDNFPAEKAKDLMQMAGKGAAAAATAQKFQFTAPSPAPAAADSVTVKTVNAPAKKPVEAEQGSASKPPQPQPNVSYLPIRRKQSLHRFMEKRKERIQARTPYQASESTGKVKQEQEENQSWLGLGAHDSVKPSLSSECS